MIELNNTVELLGWFQLKQDTLQLAYDKRIKRSLNVSDVIKKSIAYHIVNEQAIKDGYRLTDCQINKLAIVLVAKE